MSKDDNPLPRFQFKKGEFLLVDKPIEWTSFDVVNKIRHCIKKKLGIKKIKVGHAGTLDPMATGLLIICTGKFTKRLSEFQGLDKTYTGTLKLGATTPSYDSETKEDTQYPTEHINRDVLEEAKQQFVGAIEQYPPIFSAIKVNGQPLYKKARKGESVEVEPRNVHIHRFDIARIELPFVDFSVECSKGTYIRSLAHDLGKAAASGAYLTALRRTHIGKYSVDNAWQLDELIEAIRESVVLEKVQ